MGKRQKVVSKKAWTKIDTSDVEKAAVAGSKALLRNAGAEHKANAELFVIDKKGNASSRRGRREPWELKSSAILKPNDKVPVLPRNSGGKRTRETEERRLKLMAQEVEESGERLRTKVKKQKRAGMYDIWEEEEEPDFSETWPTRYKNDPLQPGNAIKEGKVVSKTASRRASRLKPEPSKYAAIDVAHPGAAYRPEEGAHRALMGKVASQIVEEEERQQAIRDRLGGRVNPKLLRQGPEVGEDDLAPSDDEDDEEEEEQAKLLGGGEGGGAGGAGGGGGGGGGGVLNPNVVVAKSGKLVERGTKLSQTERNKMVRHQEREKALQEAKALRKRERQINNLGELTKGVDKTLKQQQEEAALREEQKDEVWKHKTKRLSRHKLKVALDPVLLPEEIPQQLRVLKPSARTIKDQFEQFQKRNLIEPRKKVNFKRSQLAKKKHRNVTERAFIDF